MGVILAAGKGTRMRPFSEHWPKPILPVLGKPLMAYQLEMMAAASASADVVVVIGHLGHEVVRALGDGSRSGRVDPLRRAGGDARHRARGVAPRAARRPAVLPVPRRHLLRHREPRRRW
jgi:NDP-sugar pyrophosphorylase family protein